MKISLTKKEAEWIVAQELAPDSLRAKLITIERPPGVNAGQLEKLMETEARGKLVRLATGPGYATASRMATRLKVTTEDATLVGSWLRAQGWLGPQTLIDVLRKWETWLPKARALAGPKGVPEGFNGRSEEPENTEQRTTGQRPTTPGQRRPTL